MQDVSAVVLDLRKIPVFERHPRIFDAWEEMGWDQTLELINDHDPKPLHYQFEGEFKDGYKWEYVSNGPEEWVVRITKLRPPMATGEELKAKVEAALGEVRPYLQADGGDVELAAIDEAERVVYVRLQGACGGCPSASITLKAGVEKTIRKVAPEIERVEQV